MFLRTGCSRESAVGEENAHLSVKSSQLMKVAPPGSYSYMAARAGKPAVWLAGHVRLLAVLSPHGQH